MAAQDISSLLKKLSPSLAEGKYYYATVEESQLMSVANYLSRIICIFREVDGLTIVFSGEIEEEMQSISQEKLSGPFALITLRVNSSLMAVGLLAKVTGALAKEGIAANAFSAYRHDHLLVPYEKKEAALSCLKNLQK
ncbi:ACT domain protein [uncultured archaeon]|nr:ACT domain protein [uncultured archaeon]